MPGNLGGRNVYFGIREHAMGAILNGLALHGGVIPYGGTFLVFSDYMRAPIRLAAMMGLRVVYVFTHDSIGVGEDGPTHQPVEMLTALRAIPNLTVIRPGDAAETAEAWRYALNNTEGPTALVLTRQGLPLLDRERLAPASGLERGAYVISEASGGTPQVILLASGSEVQLALAAQRPLAEQGIPARVVSVPSLDIFAVQPQRYREDVLPRSVRFRLAVEAAESMPWWRWIGDAGTVIGMDRFGASAPGAGLFEEFGFTVDNIVESVRRMVRE
jgi:transketolase